MSNFPWPVYRALDDDGDPIPGAQLNFYEAGTTTPLATYSDEALTSANANPVVADSDGWFGQIYLQDDLYKIQLTTSVDAQVWQVDDVGPVTLESDKTLAALSATVKSPLEFGAIGDGVADESSEVQEAFDAASRVVDLCGKTYRCDSAVRFSSIDVINGTLDFSNCLDEVCLYSTGSADGAIALTGDASVGDTTLTTADISGATAGRWLQVYSGALWSAEEQGEVVQIKSATGSTITLRNGLKGSHAIANNANFQTWTTNKDIELRNLTIKCAASVAGVAQEAIRLTLCERVRINNVKIDTAEKYGIRLRRCVDVKIDGCEFDTAGEYAVTLSDGSIDVVISNSRFRCSGGGGILVGEDSLTHGPVRAATVRDCSISNALTGVEVYNGEGVNLSGLAIDAGGMGSSVGISVTGSNVDISDCDIGGMSGNGISLSSAVVSTDMAPLFYRVRGCRLRDMGTNHAIQIQSTEDFGRVEIVDNLIDATNITSNASIHYDESSNNIDDLVIRGNRINAGGYGVWVEPTGTGSIGTLEIHRNTVMSATSVGIEVDTVSGTSLVDLRITENDVLVTTAAVVAIRVITDAVATIGEVEVSRNKTNSTNKGGIYVYGTNDVTIKNNEVASASTGVLFSNNSLAGCTDIVIADNVIQDAQNSGVAVSASTQFVVDCQVRGNHISSPAAACEPINIGTKVNGLVVADNYIRRTGGTADSISIDCSSGGSAEADIRNNRVEDSGTTGNGVYVEDVDECRITGNHIMGGSNGIYFNSDGTTISDLMIDGNRVKDPDDDGIKVWCGSSSEIANCSIRNNHIEGVAGSGDYCMSLGEQITHLLITGNYTKRDDSDAGRYNIWVNDAGAGDCDALLVASNIIVNGSSGIRTEVMATAASLQDANVFVGCTAHTTAGGTVPTDGDYLDL